MVERYPPACVLDDTGINEARVIVPVIPTNVPAVADPILYNVHRYLECQRLASHEGGPDANPPTVNQDVRRIVNVVKAFHGAEKGIRRNEAVMLRRRGREPRVKLREQDGEWWRGLMIVEAESMWCRRRGSVGCTRKVTVRPRVEIRAEKGVRSRISLASWSAGR